jgi:hypothetical protein
MAADSGAIAVQDDRREKAAVLRPEIDPVAAQQAGVDANRVSVALEDLQRRAGGRVPRG